MRRTLGRASSLLRTGDVADARLLAEKATTAVTCRLVQAERLELLAEVEWDDGSLWVATAYLEEALIKAAGTRRSARGSRPGSF